MTAIRFLVQMLVIILACLAAVALVRLAAAHGDASWIMWRPATAWCCSPDECAVAAPGEIVRVMGGWRHIPTDTVLGDDAPGIFLSQDAQTWRCLYGDRLRCVFLPVGV